MSRPIWTGTINFGLVNIPVEMQMAVHEKAVHFHMITKDGGCRLRQKLYCPDTGKEYDFKDTARGIEVGPDNYAIVDQAEINRLKPEKGRALDIVQFVPITALEPIYFDRVYYLKPGKDAAKAYKLLTEAMEKTEKSAIGHFVMRERQYLCMIRPTEGGLVLHTLHYDDEVENPDEVTLDVLKRTKITDPEMKMAGELIKAMSKPLHIEEFKDEFRQALQNLVEAKAKGHTAPAPADDHAPPDHGTINLMDALKKSLAAGAGKTNGHAHRRRSA